MHLFTFCLWFDLTNVWNTNRVFWQSFSIKAYCTITCIFLIRGGNKINMPRFRDSQPHWFTIFLLYFSPLSLPPFLVFLPPLCWLPSLLWHQTWALLRSVERALGSISRITGVARAGVYGVCWRERRGPGDGCSLSWDFLLPSPTPSLLPSPGFRHLPILPPTQPCQFGLPLSTSFIGVWEQG